MAISDIIPLLIRSNRFNHRALWASLFFLVVFLLTISHLNINNTASISTPFQLSSAHTITLSHNSPSLATDTRQHSPAFTEVANAPLRIFVPAAIPSKESLLKDIWATAGGQSNLDNTQKNDDAKKPTPTDKEAYYKFLKCPVCKSTNEDEKEKAKSKESPCPDFRQMMKNIEEANAKKAKEKCPPEKAFDFSKCPKFPYPSGTTTVKTGGVKDPHHPDVGVPPAAGTDQSVSVVGDNVTTRTLISYIYTESNSSRTNLEFFVNHALHSTADFVFVLYGPTTVDKDLLPKGQPNINIFKKPLPAPTSNFTCSPLAAHFSVVDGRDQDVVTPLKDIYSHFVLLDSSIRGPFIPRWSTTCWSSSLTALLTDETKLVGAELACVKDKEPHLTPHFLATDQIGLKALLNDQRTHRKDCPKDPLEAVKVRKMSERDVTAVMSDAGFGVAVLDSAFRDPASFVNVKCPFDMNRFVGLGGGNSSSTASSSSSTSSSGAEAEIAEISTDPWEVMFVPAGEFKGIKPEEKQKELEERMWLDIISQKVKRGGYSSYEVCVREALMSSSSFGGSGSGGGGGSKKAGEGIDNGGLR